MTDHSALARRLIDENHYMTLGTADGERPALGFPGLLRRGDARAVLLGVLPRGTTLTPHRVRVSR